MQGAWVDLLPEVLNAPQNWPELASNGAQLGAKRLLELTSHSSL